MRSGSSLLTHILISNPEITGFGETHLKYSTDKNYLDLVCKVSLLNRIFIKMGNERYILDKILHNHLLEDTDLTLLKKNNCKVIFLVREPEDSVKSIITTLKYTEKEAIKYYQSRLKHIGSLSQGMDKNISKYFLKFNELINDNDNVLTSLSKFLGLDSRLRPEYKIHRTTGKKGIGDIGNNIFAGRIIAPKANDDISLNESTIKSLNKIYNDFVKLFN